MDIQFYRYTFNKIKLPKTCWKGNPTTNGVIYYTFEHNTIYSLGGINLNTIFSSTDTANYLYNNGPPTRGVSHHRYSENKNANIIKDTLLKVKINDLGLPFLRYRIANQRLLMGTSINWNLNVNHTTFSECD